MRYGILTLLLIPVILGGVVYMGMNAEKYTSGFGEPSAISAKFTVPTNDLIRIRSDWKLCFY